MLCGHRGEHGRPYFFVKVAELKTSRHTASAARNIELFCMRTKSKKQSKISVLIVIFISIEIRKQMRQRDEEHSARVKMAVRGNETRKRCDGRV